ncbi:WXG100 family type VII secretion target [Streptomyces lydicus]|uniref:WXG100 family type VII secretion target n=1 Tax=Streptomyces lydicus TaxID=47763 RepID=UPI0037B3F501
MTSDYMSVETGALDSHARNLSDHADAVRAMRERLLSSLAALGSPWGEGDAYATSFAQWYKPASEKLMDSLQGIADQIGQTHQAVNQASENYKTNAAAAE